MTRLIDADKLKEKAVERLELATQRVADTPTNSPCYQRYCSQASERTYFIDAIDNAPTASPKEICIANIHFDKEQMQEIVDKAIIRCKDCKHQKKFWHEDKRMKEKGYWIYGCNLIDDSFVGTPVWGGDNQFCSSAERKGE